MARFATIFDTPHGQLLFYKTTDDDDEPAIRVVGAAVGGVVPAANLGYDDEPSRDDAFDKLNQADAEKQAESFYALAAQFANKAA